MKTALWIISLILLTACGGTQKNSITLKIGESAPQFVSTDKDGSTIELSKLYEKGPVVLSFLRSFYCPYCRKHLDALTQDYKKFEDANISVVAISQDDAEDVNEYWSEHNIPFAGIPDQDETLKSLYYQQDSALAPLPAVFVIDTNGILRLTHYADGMKDIPTTDRVLKAAQQTATP